MKLTSTHLPLSEAERIISGYLSEVIALPVIGVRSISSAVFSAEAQSTFRNVSEDERK